MASIPLPDSDKTKLQLLKMKHHVVLYIDFKSPYSYLSLEPTFRLAETHDVNFEFRPFILNIPEVYGDLGSRDEQQWRKVRYLYKDVRHFANDRGLVIYGPEKIIDSRLAAICILFSQLKKQIQTLCDISI